MYMLLMHQRKRVHMHTKALEIPKVLMKHAHIISCDLSCMGAWDVRLPPVVQSEVTYPNFSYPNLHLSEPPK